MKNFFFKLKNNNYKSDIARKKQLKNYEQLLQCYIDIYLIIKLNTL